MKRLIRAAEVWIWWKIALEVAGTVSLLGTLYFLWWVLKNTANTFGL